MKLRHLLTKAPVGDGGLVSSGDSDSEGVCKQKIKLGVLQGYSKACLDYYHFSPNAVPWLDGASS